MALRWPFDTILVNGNAARTDSNSSSSTERRRTAPADGAMSSQEGRENEAEEALERQRLPFGGVEFN